MKHRASPSSTISLAPSGMNQNEVLKYIMDDVSIGSVEV